MPATSERVVLCVAGGTTASAVLGYLRPVRSALLEITKNSFALLSGDSMFQQGVGAIYVFLILFLFFSLILLAGMYLYFRHKEKMKEEKQNSLPKGRTPARKKGKRKK